MTELSRKRKIIVIINTISPAIISAKKLCSIYWREYGFTKGNKKKVEIAAPNQDITKSPPRIKPSINPVIAPRSNNIITPTSSIFMGKFSIYI